MFNSLKYAKLLEDSGVSRGQAETHVKVLSEAIGGEMVTKEVLKSELGLMRSEFTEETSKIKVEIAETKTEFGKELSKIKEDTSAIKAEILGMQDRIVFRLGGLIFSLCSLALGFMKFIN